MNVNIFMNVLVDIWNLTVTVGQSVERLFECSEYTVDCPDFGWEWRQKL